MGKYEDAINALRAWFDDLPGEAKKKCALCNETLTHIVKKAEVETGAGTATVTKVLAETINEGAAAGDKVSANALRVRVQNHEGKTKCRNPANAENPDAPTVKPVTFCNTPDAIAEEVAKKVGEGMTVSAASRDVAEKAGKDPEVVRQTYLRKKVGDPASASQAMNIIGFAICQLERLSKNDPKWEEAITKLESWIARFKEQKA